MKELKFRVYDTKNRFMLYYKLEELIEAIYDSPHNTTGNIQDLLTTISCDDFDLFHMQYIGKSDMNGTNIYEGDIIYKELYARDDPAYGHYGAIGVVKEDLHNIGWFIEDVDGEDNFYCREGINFDFNEIKIIGNIYENPKLIE